MYRYIGNKTKLLPQIISAVDKVIGNGETVADVMAGTGSVSAALRANNYRVVASDVMTYSTHHLVTQLLMDAAPSFANLRGIAGVYDYEGVLGYLNRLEPIEGYFYREFSPSGTPRNGTSPRKYFTSANAAKIDAVRNTLSEWYRAGLLTSNQRSLLLHDLIMAANEVANISGTYGYFLANFPKSSMKELHLVETKFLPGRTDHTVLQGYAEELSRDISADVCYIDPPYIKRQYAANYHILETLARGDEPEAQGKSGLRPWRDQYSNLCTKTKGLETFERIISGMDCGEFLISYSEDGLYSIAQLVSLFESFGSVEVETLDYKRFRSNQSSLNSSLKEYLFFVHRR